MAPTIFLDTNACVLPFTQRIDVKDELLDLVGEFEVRLPSSIRDELQYHARGKDAFSRAAKAALSYWTRSPVDTCRYPGDEGVLELISSWVVDQPDVYLLTNDKRLQAEAAKRGAGIIEPRSGTKLHIARRPGAP